MLQFEYEKPMKDIQVALDEGDKSTVLELHKTLLSRTGVLGYYYGSCLYNKVEKFINAKV